MWSSSGASPTAIRGICRCVAGIHGRTLRSRSEDLVHCFRSSAVHPSRGVLRAKRDPEDHRTSVPPSDLIFERPIASEQQIAVRGVNLDRTGVGQRLTDVSSDSCAYLSARSARLLDSPKAPSGRIPSATSRQSAAHNSRSLECGAKPDGRIDIPGKFAAQASRPQRAKDPKCPVPTVQCGTR